MKLGATQSPGEGGLRQGVLREELRRGKVLRTSREKGRGESCEDLCRGPEWHLQAVSPGGGIPQGKEFLSLRS